MTVSTEQYIRKPLYVDAIRVTSSNFDEVADWCQGRVLEEDEPGKGSKKFIRVRVHNPINPKQTKAFVGDWLLYTEKGYKIYTNTAFKASFDEVDDEDPDPHGGQTDDFVLGSEELLPGITINEAVQMVREGRLGLVAVPQPNPNEEAA